MLIAVLDGRGKPASLEEVIERMDWVGRVLPTGEEVIYGANRLLASGLLTVDVPQAGRFSFAPTAPARELWRSVRRHRPADLLASVAEALGAPPYPVDETPDRSLGPLPGLSPEAVSAAIRAHTDDVERAGKRLAWLMRRVGSSMGWDKDAK